MSLVTMKEMLNTASQEKFAVGAFEFWSYDSARAVVSAARRNNVPVILQVGHFERDYMDGYPNAYKFATMAAGLTDCPVALHLDHAEDIEEIQRALDAGFTSVMIDASMKPFEENIEITQKVVELARRYGATVEAELGKLGGTEGNIVGGESDEQTDPEQAAVFVEQTQIDALAVAIGTAHGFYSGVPHINIERLKRIREVVSVPLVLHGGSATPEEKIVQSIENGIAKINICTEFIYAYGVALSKAQKEADFKYNVFSLFKAGSDAGEQLVEDKIKLFTTSLRS